MIQTFGRPASSSKDYMNSHYSKESDEHHPSGLRPHEVDKPIEIVLDEASSDTEAYTKNGKGSDNAGVQGVRDEPSSSNNITE